MGNTIAADAANVGQFFVAEPFGLGVGIKGAARTAEGGAGVLSHWWAGIGVESGADVLKTANATPGTTRAYEYMASHGLSDIKKAFPRMYTDEQYKWLSQAKTPQEVINLHADIADAVGLTRHVAPTLGLGRFLLSSSRSGLMAWQKVSENFSALEQSSKEVLDHYGVVDFHPTSATEAGGAPLIRADAALRRWAAARVTKATMHVVEADTLAHSPFVETKIMSSSGKNAIPALADAFKASGLFNDREIATMTDTLHALPAGADLSYAMTNLIGSMMHGALSRLTDTAVLQPVDSIIKIQLQDMTQQMFQMTNGGLGRYGNGELGSAMDILRDPADATKVASFGFAKSHVGNMVIPDPRYIRNFITSYAKALTYTVGKNMTLATDLSDAEALQQAADFAHASLQGATGELSKITAQRLRSLQGSQETATAYSAESDHINRLINGINADKSLTHAEKFSQVLTNLDGKIGLLETTAQTDKSVQVAAQLMANKDARSLLSRQVTDLGMSDAQVSTIAKRIADTSGVTGEARQELADTIESGLRKSRDSQGNFTTGLNHVSNGFNHMLSEWFVPLMLSTGGYITRITSSEVMLSLARMGGPQFLQSQIARSVAKELSAVGRKPIEFKYAEHLISEQIGHIVGGVGKTIADTMKGTAYGAAAGIGKSISKEEFGRLIEHAAQLRTLHDSMPDIGHATTQLYGESDFKTGSRQQVYGMEEKNGIKVPKMSKGYRGGTFVSADGTNVVTALRDQVALVAHDPMTKFSAQHLQTLMESSGYKTLTHEQYNQLWNAMTEVEHQRILAMPAHELSALRASTWPIASPELTTGDAIKDLAKRISNNTMSLGLDRNKLNEWVPNRTLVDAMATGQIPDSAALSRELESSKTAGPMSKHIVTSQFTRFPWNEGVTKWSRAVDKFMAAPSYMNQMVVDRLFGHMISWGSREPIYLWEYHKAMDALGEKVASNVITKEEAMLEAQNEAFHRLMKFVHNPADRFNYEARTRAYAPFWFAKNQMYRRGLRTLEENPAGFYNYLRYSTLATVGVSQFAAANAPAWILPFADTPAYLIGRMAKFFPTGLPRDLAGNLGMSLAGSPQSLSSVLPTGTNYEHVPANSPWTNYLEAIAKDLGSATRPDVSPPVAVGLMEMEHAGLGHEEWYHKAVTTILGPVGSSQGILANLIPSTFYRGAVTVGAAAIGMGSGMGTPAPIAQLEVKAQNAMLDKWMSELSTEYRKGNPIPAGTTPSQDYVNTEVTWAQFQIAQAMHDPTKYANFMNEARGAALGLYIARLMVYFPSPVSVYLKERFSKVGNLDKYMKMKDAQGNPVSFSTAMAMYAYHEPKNILDTVSHYQEPYGTYPTTQKAIEWIQKAPEVIKQFPNLAATLIPTNGKFDYSAIGAEVNANLRHYDTPSQYLDAVLKTIGNNFYYNYLEPAYYKQYGTWVGPDSSANQISYTGYKKLQTAAESYARTTNLAWQRLGSPLSETSKSLETTTISQAQAFLTDPKAQQQVISSGLLSKSDVSALQQSMQYYTSQIALIGTLSGTAKYDAEQQVYTTMTANAADPQNVNIASFLMMLARTPTK